MSSFEITLTILLVLILLFVTYQYKTSSLKQLTVLSFVYLIAIFITGIIIHYIFNVNTQLNYLLELAKCQPDYNSLLGIFEQCR